MVKKIDVVRKVHATDFLDGIVTCMEDESGHEVVYSGNLDIPKEITSGGSCYAWTNGHVTADNTIIIDFCIGNYSMDDFIKNICDDISLGQKIIFLLSSIGPEIIIFLEEFMKYDKDYSLVMTDYGTEEVIKHLVKKYSTKSVEKTTAVKNNYDSSDSLNASLNYIIEINKSNKDKKNMSNVNIDNSSKAVMDDLIGKLSYATNIIHENTGSLTGKTINELKSVLVECNKTINKYTAYKDSFKSKFIVFEGIDGSGKTTQVDTLVKKLNSDGIPAVGIKNIFNDRIGKLIRDIMEGKTDLYAGNQQMAALFLAEMYVVNQSIKKHIDAGTVVVCDRWLLSTIAYSANTDVIKKGIELLGAELLVPDIVIYMDIDADAAYNRISSRDSNKDIYSSVHELNIIRNRYKDALVDTLTGYKLIHMYVADKTIDELSNEIYNKLIMLQGYKHNKLGYTDEWLRKKIEYSIIDNDIGLSDFLNTWIGEKDEQ